MEYSIYELLFFLFFYSFLGWCVEVIIMTIQTRRFCNRGILNAPLCLSYGITMVVLLLFFSSMQNNYILQYVACVVIVSCVESISGYLVEHLMGKAFWDSDSQSIFGGKKKGILISLLLGAGALCVILLVHPIVFIFCQLIPSLLFQFLVILFAILLFLDLISVFYVIRKTGLIHFQVQKIPLEEPIKERQRYQNSKFFLGKWLSNAIWKRLLKAYPALSTEEGQTEQKKDCYIFAKGICFDKLVWVFLLCALFGDIIETFFVRFSSGIWMSRSSVIYGPFSIVWGAGAVLLTVVLKKLAEKEDRYIFLGGCLLGGTYEYMCSVFTEIFLGTTFWDYSDMRFNIGGRTNLLFCIFWGILSLVWVKICYPRISEWIEKVPPLIGKIATWTALILMSCDIVLSALAMTRYIARNEGNPPSNIIETFIDTTYPDELVEFIWPNMRIQ